MTDEKKEEKEKKTKKELQEDIEALKQEKEEYLNGWKRAKADFLNYKKNEKERIKKTRQEEKRKFILEILEVLDNFYLAEENMNKDKINENYLSGFQSIKKQLINILKSHGVKEISCVGEEFDPNLHEAVAMIDDEEAGENMVIEEVRKGYLLDGKLLRPAKVKVSK